jgi:hypothetical protein
MPCSIISTKKFLGSSQNIDLSIWDAQEMSIPSKSLCVLKALIVQVVVNPTTI